MTSKFPFTKKHLSRRNFIQVLGGLSASLLAPIKHHGRAVALQNGQPLHQVVIGKEESYTASSILNKVDSMFEELGGINRLIQRGDKVAIKLNLTGGSTFATQTTVPAIESYMTHPEVVRACATLVREAGAQQLYLVESVSDRQSFVEFGYDAIATELDATLIDLNSPAPYTDFHKVSVGDDWYIYPEFMMNPLLQDVDVFISIAKMKCHSSAGVTLSMKNLIGLVPVSLYRADPTHNWRSALHGNFEPGRIPRVIVDINRTRPIDLAIIDGIKTAEGGELPRGNFNPIEPGVLVLGQNAVATDAVATAIMGFDPTADYPDAPFLNGHNHLNLASSQQLGSNRLEEIEVLGVPITDVQQHFIPAIAETG